MARDHDRILVAGNRPLHPAAVFVPRAAFCNVTFLTAMTTPVAKFRCLACRARGHGHFNSVQVLLREHVTGVAHMPKPPFQKSGMCFGAT